MRDNIIILFLAVTISSYAQTITDKEYKITSVYFKEERTIKVHLPKDFKENEKLPVIYVFDAQWTPYFNLVSSSIDYLTRNKRIT